MHFQVAPLRTLGWDQHAPNLIQWVKKNQTSSWIEYGGDADRIGDVEEVLKSDNTKAEKTGDLGGSNDGAFRSGLCRGGRRGWDRRYHPNLQACRKDASGSYALPPWTPSCRCGGARETLAGEWTGMAVI
jgi:hypothetical protein